MSSHETRFENAEWKRGGSFWSHHLTVTARPWLQSREQQRARLTGTERIITFGPGDGWVGTGSSVQHDWRTCFKTLSPRKACVAQGGSWPLDGPNQQNARAKRQSMLLVRMRLGLQPPSRGMLCGVPAQSVETFSTQWHTVYGGRCISPACLETDSLWRDDWPLGTQR